MDIAARYAATQPPLSPALAAELEVAVVTHRDVHVRGAALGALVRAGGQGRGRAAWDHAAGDGAAAIRRRAAELAPELSPPPVDGLLTLLEDRDTFVAETAAWALGEITWTGRTLTRVVEALSTAAGSAPDPLVRESAVAALGAIGDPSGLAAILAACSDRPPIRRRAVLALAPFDGPEVDAALEQALTDSDWQVRQAAEDLTATD